MLSAILRSADWYLASSGHGCSSHLSQSWYRHLQGSKETPRSWCSVQLSTAWAEEIRISSHGVVTSVSLGRASCYAWAVGILGVALSRSCVGRQSFRFCQEGIHRDGLNVFLCKSAWANGCWTNRSSLSATPIVLRTHWLSKSVTYLQMSSERSSLAWHWSYRRSNHWSPTCCWTWHCSRNDCLHPWTCWTSRHHTGFLSLVRLCSVCHCLVIGDSCPEVLAWLCSWLLSMNQALVWPVQFDIWHRRHRCVSYSWTLSIGQLWW